MSEKLALSTEAEFAYTILPTLVQKAAALQLTSLYLQVEDASEALSLVIGH